MRNLCRKFYQARNRQGIAATDLLRVNQGGIENGKN